MTQAVRLRFRDLSRGTSGPRNKSGGDG